MTNQSQAVLVTPRVLEALDKIRRSGLTNMLDRTTVAELAETFGYPDAANWIRTHRQKYSQGIFNGFTAGEEQRS
jgi:hypothetical protein